MAGLRNHHPASAVRGPVCRGRRMLLRHYGGCEGQASAGRLRFGPVRSSECTRSLPTQKHQGCGIEGSPAGLPDLKLAPRGACDCQSRRRGSGAPRPAQMCDSGRHCRLTRLHGTRQYRAHVDLRGGRSSPGGRAACSCTRSRRSRGAPSPYASLLAVDDVQRRRAFARAVHRWQHKGGVLTWRSQRLEDVRVVVVGETAVLTALVTDEVRKDGQDQSFTLRLTQTWVRAEGGWQSLAGHAGPEVG